MKVVQTKEQSMSEGGEIMGHVPYLFYWVKREERRSK